MEKSSLSLQNQLLKWNCYVFSRWQFKEMSFLHNRGRNGLSNLDYQTFQKESLEINNKILKMNYKISIYSKHWSYWGSFLGKKKIWKLVTYTHQIIWESRRYHFHWEKCSSRKKPTENFELELHETNSAGEIKLARYEDKIKATPRR